MRMRDLEVGVLMWKVTLSKSETTWSMAVGVALLWHQLGERGVLRQDECSLGRKAVAEEGLDEDVLVVEEEHGEGYAGEVRGEESEAAFDNLLSRR